MSGTTPILGLTQPTVGGDNGTWGGLLDTDLANLDTYLAVLRQAAKAVTIGATTTLDFNAPASVFSLTVSQATIIAIANTPANITAQQLSTQFTLLVTNGGAFAVTWPGSFVWSGGQPPNLQVSGTDIIVGWSPDNGTTWYTAALSTSGKTTLFKVGQLANVSTSSTSDANLGSAINLSAGKLAVNGDFIRITITGRYNNVSAVVGGTLKFKFGAATLIFTPLSQGNIAGQLPFTAILSVSRLTATTQRLTAMLTAVITGAPGTPGPLYSTTTGSETLANAVAIQLLGSCSNGADTLSIDSVVVEAATQ